jgi:hypothetical protein
MRRWLVVAGAAVLALSACSGDDSGDDGDASSDTPSTTSVPIPVADVSGPVEGGVQGRPFGTALSVDLADYDYVEEEYLLSGDARTYGPAEGTTLTADGEWDVVETGAVPYTTRMLVRRPVDPDDFNGTVMVVWLNTSAGFEIGDYGDPSLHERGYVQVYVSALVDGHEGLLFNGSPGFVPGLIEWDPERYGSLDLPSNDAAFDVYTQAAAAVGPDRRGEVDPLEGFDVEHVIAHGGSQSAAWLLTYFNAVHPLVGLFDAFLPATHFGTGRPLAEGIDPPEPVQFRSDSDTPLLVMNTENEAAAYAPSRQPDTETFRLWEYTGLNHTGGIPGEERLIGLSQRDFGLEFPPPASCDRPLSSVEGRYIYAAATVAVDNWVRTGEPPTPGERISIVGGDVERDEHGIAVGGIRIPPVAVPTSTLGAPNGERTDTQCFLQGYELPFDAATVAELHPDREQYLDDVQAVGDELVERGHLLPESAGEELDRAADNPAVR